MPRRMNSPLPPEEKQKQRQHYIDDQGRASLKKAFPARHEQVREHNRIGRSPISFGIDVEDCDALFKRALAAGGETNGPMGQMADQFWATDAERLPIRSAINGQSPRAGKI
jgi:hypothetical protein